jgi:lipopolysaccharide/colanic/teichoic acid biosynthesis glycosyltransferase
MGAPARAVRLTRGGARARLVGAPFSDWQRGALRAAGIDSVRELRFSDAPLGSAGALGSLRDWLRGLPFVLVFGSTFVDARCVRALLAQRAGAAAGWIGSAAVTGAAPANAPIESLCAGEAGELRAAASRHVSTERRDGRRLAGLFLFSDEILDLIPAGRYFDLKEHLLPEVRARGRRIDTLAVQRSHPVLSAEEQLRLQLELLEAAGGANRVALGEGCVVDPGVRVVGPVLLGEQCRLESGCVVVGPAILGARCHIGARAVIHCSVLDDDVAVGADGYVGFSLLGARERVRAGERCLKAQAVALAPAHMQPRVPLAQLAAQGVQAAAKRAFDFAIALAGIVAASPLFALIALAIKLDSPGPVLFVQRRCGRDGREFPMLKFRSMVPNAQALQRALRAQSEVDGPTFKLAHDPRITRVGRWLRRTSLDELPQLVNVLAGQMSLVGPRPLVMQEMSVNAYWRDRRLSVAPGITGLWQVEARDDARFQRWVELDVRYAGSRSLLLDMKILAKTAAAALRGL